MPFFISENDKSFFATLNPRIFEPKIKRYYQRKGKTYRRENWDLSKTTSLQNQGYTQLGVRDLNSTGIY